MIATCVPFVLETLIRKSCGQETRRLERCENSIRQRRIKKIFAKQNLRASKVGIINGPRHTYLELPFHWLNLMGFRLAVERGLVMGGLGAVKTVAAVELGLSRGETEQWTVELLFNVYCDTKLREQWDYEGFRFRLNEQAKQIEYC